MSTIDNPRDSQIQQPLNHVVIYRHDKGHLDSTPYLEKEEGGLIPLASPLTQRDQTVIKKHHELHQDLVIEDDHSPFGKPLTPGQKKNLTDYDKLMEKVRNGEL